MTKYLIGILFLSTFGFSAGFSQSPSVCFQGSRHFAGCSSSLLRSHPPANAIDRMSFLNAVVASFSAASLLFVAPSIATASDDLLKKGTKEDPKFQACLGQCMYDCTKQKGAEQKSRAECLPECKQKCATTKQQLLKGIPKE